MALFELKGTCKNGKSLLIFDKRYYKINIVEKLHYLNEKKCIKIY